MCKPKYCDVFLTDDIKESILNKTYNQPDNGNNSFTHEHSNSPTTINIVQNNVVNNIVNIFKLPCGTYVQTYLDHGNVNSPDIDENTKKLLKSRNIDSNVFNFKTQSGSNFDTSKCLTDDKLMALIHKSTRCKDKGVFPNYLFDEKSESHLFQTEKSVFPYKLEDIKLHVIEQLKEHFLHEYENYLIRGMYSKSASSNDKEDAKKYLFRLFKFYFAFDTKPCANHKRNHIILPTGYPNDFELIMNEDKCIDLYAVCKSIMNMYEDVCDMMSARELRHFQQFIDKSILGSSKENMEVVQGKILSLLQTDPSFKGKMLQAQHGEN